MLKSLLFVLLFGISLSALAAYHCDPEIMKGVAKSKAAKVCKHQINQRIDALIKQLKEAKKGI